MNQLSTSDRVKLATGLIAFLTWVALVYFKVPGADDLIAGCKLYLVSIGAYHLKTSQGDFPVTTIQAIGSAAAPSQPIATGVAQVASGSAPQ